MLIDAVAVAPGASPSPHVRRGARAAVSMYLANAYVLL